MPSKDLTHAKRLFFGVLGRVFRVDLRQEDFGLRSQIATNISGEAGFGCSADIVMFVTMPEGNRLGAGCASISTNTKESNFFQPCRTCDSIMPDHDQNNCGAPDI